MKLKTAAFSFILAGSLIMSSCMHSSASDYTVGQDAEYDKDGGITIGHSLRIENVDPQLTLRMKNEVLAAEGLYYTTWTMGDASEYINSNEETIDLYDAQLYLLFGEAASAEKATANMDTWLNTARSNYEIISTENIRIHEQTYTVISYNCISENSPYDRGISAFTTYENSALCAEFTCTESFNDELQPLLMEFLTCCSFISEQEE